MIQVAIFYLFSTILVLSAVMVITAKNPVHAVLFLIVCFFNTAALFVLLGAEFLAFMLIIVYAGALSVLFLFIVMMLNVDFTSLRKDIVKYAPVGLLVGAVLLIELFLLFQSWSHSVFLSQNIIHPIPDHEAVTNTKAIGAILYTDYAYIFILSGVILLLAMIGSITLTLRDTNRAKQQNGTEQAETDPDKILNIQKVTPGAGM